MRTKTLQHRTLRARHVLSATAAAAASAVFAQHASAVTLNQYYYDVSIYSDPGLTNLVSSVVINQSNPTVNIPMGDYLSFGISDVLTNNPNPAAGDTSGKAPNNLAQPANLGIASISYTLMESDHQALALAPNISVGSRGVLDDGRTDYSTTAAILPDPTYMPAQDPGDATVGSGEIGLHFQIASQAALPIQSGSTDGVATLTEFTPTSGSTASIATSTPLFDNLSYQAVNVGTVSVSPQVDPLAFGYWVNSTIGSGTTASTYKFSPSNAPSTIVPLPALVVNISGIPLPVHPIISLTTAAPNSNYAAQIFSPQVYVYANDAKSGQLAMTDSDGSYTVAQATEILDGEDSTAGPTTDYIAAIGLNPASGIEEIFAMAVSVTGAPLAILAADINSTNAYGFGSSIASTSLANDPFPSMYNLFLTFNSSDPALANGTDYLGFDFTQDPNVTGATVTAIAVTAVPEPMTFGALALGLVGGLLLRRRIRTAQI